MREHRSVLSSPPLTDCILSVVIPAHNYAAFLVATLDSVVSQLTGEMELIVVDDGSTDTTALILADYVVPNEICAAYVHQENSGAGAARNRAVALARGRWILPLDADDALYPGALASILLALKQSPETELLVGGYVVSDLKGNKKMRKASRLPELPHTRVKGFLLGKRISVVHGAVVFARTLLLNCPYPEMLRQGEDISVFAHALARPHVYRLARPLAIISKHPDSLRHDFNLPLSHGNQLIEQVFSSLPTEYAIYRTRFEGQRALSVFRRCYRAGELNNADLLFRKAWRLSWQQACRWSYLSKWLRLRLSLAYTGERS